MGQGFCQQSFWITYDLKIWFVLFSLLYVFYAQAINHHHYLRITQPYASNIPLISRNIECALFQSLVIQRETYTLPVQQLYFVPAFIDEDEHVPIAGVAAQFVANNAR